MCGMIMSEYCEMYNSYDLVKCMYGMIMSEYCEMYNIYASKVYEWHDYE